MPRFFNVAGPCVPGDHYMLPWERRIPGVRKLIDDKLYFVIHAPRQVGKTTSFRQLAMALTAEGRYAAMHASCETGQAARNNVELGVQAVVSSIRLACEQQLTEALRPPREDSAEAPVSRLKSMLTAWAETSPVPVVLFLDEIDALFDDVLISVLRQLRDGYVTRPERFPQSVALIGLRDVRDYRIAEHVRPDQATLGTSSPFNVKVRSLTLRDFTADEVAELYRQHTEETGQAFTDEALARAFELTCGQPWLVNALADQVVRDQVLDRSTTITEVHIDHASEALIERRDTHLDSLIDKLREERVRRVLEPILAGDLLLPDTLDDDITYVQDLGLVTPGPEGLEAANPIYREVIPRALARVMQQSLPIPSAPYRGADGTLRMGKLMRDFVAFWCEHAEVLLHGQPYPEIAPHLVLMAFLQRVVNGGGFIDREYAAGRGRIDLCVRWPHPGGLQREAIELKVWRQGKPDPLAKGLDQLSAYLDRLGLSAGYLVIFDRRPDAVPLSERAGIDDVAHQGHAIIVVRG